MATFSVGRRRIAEVICTVLLLSIAPQPRLVGAQRDDEALERALKDALIGDVLLQEQDVVIAVKRDKAKNIELVQVMKPDLTVRLALHPRGPFGRPSAEYSGQAAVGDSETTWVDPRC